MLRILPLLAILLYSTFPAHAQETELVPLETRDDQRGWEAVGRLDIQGKGFCTAAMIKDNLILTAAHCVYHDDGSLIDPSAFTFNAGLRAGRAEASRGISSLIAHPNYVHDGPETDTEGVAMDIAVLKLIQPIRRARIQPFRVAEEPVRGDEIGVVSYGRGRSEEPSLQEVCSVIGRQTGVVVMTCDVEFGSSGSPVFTLDEGRPRIVSVVSAMGTLGDEQVSLGTSLQEPLRRLLSHFSSLGPARPGGTQRLIQIGEQNDTGAKFVRPKH